MSNLDTALRFARAGFHVVPVELIIEPGKSPRKKPHVKWKDTPTPTVDEVIRWWGRWPKAMVGLILRKVGLLVLDGDRHPHPKTGEIVNDGVQALRDLFKSKQVSRRSCGRRAAVCTFTFAALPDLGMAEVTFLPVLTSAALPVW